MLASRTMLSSVLLVAAVVAACTKTDPPAPTTASATPSAGAAATATATASAAATPSAEPSAEPTATASAAATSTATAEKPAGKDGGASAAASGSAAAPECGTKPLPDCPLQAWMKSNANPPVMTNDVAALEGVLTKIAGMAPAGYTNWATIAKDGAKAAKGGDMAAAKASCKGCHDQYKQKYKTEMRGRKI